MSGDWEKGSRTIKLTVEYDGTEFSGWQVQPNRRTVQGEIERTLHSLTQERIRVVGAGRTDAGVHALGQVVSFRCRSPLLLERFERGLNGLLPGAIRVVQVEEAEAAFDARRDAVRRRYRYLLSRRPRAVGRQYAWYPRMRFSLEPMRQASEYLLGEHDFTGFCKADEGSSDFTSCVYDVNWREDEGEVAFEITARRFYHNMVRIIVGTLLEVGRGRMTPGRFRDVLESRDRRWAGPTVPPHGLYLVRVDF